MKNNLIFAAALTAGAVVLCLLATSHSGLAIGAGSGVPLGDLVATMPPTSAPTKLAPLPQLPRSDEVVWVQVAPGPGVIMDGEAEVIYCPFIPASSALSP